MALTTNLVGDPLPSSFYLMFGSLNYDLKMRKLRLSL